MKKLCKKLAAQCKRLRTQLFWAYFLLFALFFAGISALVALAFRGLLIGQIGNNRMDVLRQIAERTNTVKTSSITLSNLYSYEIQNRGFLNNGMTAGQQEQAKIYLDAQKQMYDEVFSHIGLGYEIVLLGANGFWYDSEGAVMSAQALEQQLWYRQLLTNLNSEPLGEVQFSRTFDMDTGKGCKYQFAAGRLLGQEGQQSVLLILIDERILEDQYASAQSQESEIYIYDQNGFIVSHPNKKMLGKQFIDVDYMQAAYGLNSCDIVRKRSEDYLLSTYLDEETGWTIVEEIPTRVTFAALDRVYLIVCCTLAVGLVLAILLALYMSRRISRPLTELSAAMSEFGSRDFKALPANTGTQELDLLRENFNHMAVEIFHLMDAVQDREQQKRVLETNFLRAQINPHFLYNMLFSIRCTVEIGKNGQATQMIDAFIDLLRSTLAIKDSTIPLWEELESTRKYLVVQKLRYGEKVNYEIDMQEGSEQCMVPSLILQPLVENAIFHGLEAKADADMVVIESTLKDGDLLLMVTDDGAGMEPEELERVRARFRRPGVKGANSIGMANVHNRIRLNYGEEYGLSIESTRGIGTTVTLRMPAVFQKEGEGNEGFDRG